MNTLITKITKRKFLPWVLSVVFLVIQIVTLKDYGISWDETLHFRRGQAYLNYFLTGNLDFSNLPELNLQGTEGDPKKIPSPRRSFYQADTYTADFLLKNDSGHPPLNGELAALTNYIFFQKLGVLDDVSSHHLFNVLASTLMVFVVVSFVLEVFGVFPAIVSFLSLFTYPLFFAEAHFNIKDPPEAAFFTATIWAVYKAVNTNQLKWLCLSFIFFALGLGTKFNIFFIPLILIPYLIIKLRDRLKMPESAFKLLISKSTLVVFGGMVFSVGVLFLVWPYLWQIIPNNFLSIFGYYKDIGTGTRYQSEGFYWGGFNTFPFQWILFTSPPILLILFVLGASTLLSRNFKQRAIVLLWLWWFLVPIIRVSLPNTVIYGGIRQVMEFLPAMVMIAGVGAWQTMRVVNVRWKTKRIRVFLTQVVLVSLFFYPLVVLVKMHPNENVYFNFLIGGLSGAEERSFPSWGNSFGNAYFQGIKWINQNVERDSKLALIQGTTANLPAIFLRADINYQNTNWSGIDRGGEYLMDLTFNDTSKDYFYAWEYVDKFLQPVYELKVNQVAILKVWKNDLLHTKPEMRKQEVTYLGEINKKEEEGNLIVSLRKTVLLSRLEILYPKDSSCLSNSPIFIDTSLDGEQWFREKDYIPYPQVYRKVNILENQIIFFFAAREAQYIRVNLNHPNCEASDARTEVIVLQ